MKETQNSDGVLKKSQFLVFTNTIVSAGLQVSLVKGCVHVARGKFIV